MRMKKPGKGLPEIPFTAVTADGELADLLRAEGHASYPVVKVDYNGESWSWSGFRESEITRLAELVREGDSG